MDTLKNRQRSRAAKAENNGEQVPTKVTESPKNGDDDTTQYVPGDTFHDQLKTSARIDVQVASDDAERQQAERIAAAIHAPGKTTKREETAELDAQTASNSANAAGTAQSQANQTGTGETMQSQQTKNATGGNGGGADGWTSGSAAVNGNATQQSGQQSGGDGSGAPPTPGTKANPRTKT